MKYYREKQELVSEFTRMVDQITKLVNQSRRCGDEVETMCLKDERRVTTNIETVVHELIIAREFLRIAMDAFAESEIYESDTVLRVWTQEELQDS